MAMYTRHIGLNYKGTSYTLQSCKSDADDMLALYQGNSTNSKTYDRMTINGFKAMISELVSMVVDGDIVVISFSGHGTQRKDRTGDEADGKDECLLFDDAQLVDDDLRIIMEPLYSKFIRIIWYLDACHSGTMIDLPYGSTGPVYKPVKTSVTNFTSNALILSISACSDSETDGDGKWNGMLTTYVKTYYGTDPDRCLTNFAKMISIPGQKLTFSSSILLDGRMDPFLGTLPNGNRGTLNKTTRNRGCVVA